MTIGQRLSLLWRRFSPLEARLFAAVRSVLPAAAVPIFDGQVRAIRHVQRLPGWTEIDDYARRAGKDGLRLGRGSRARGTRGLAERPGARDDEFILHRVEPVADGLFRPASPDGTPERIRGDVAVIFQRS